MDNYREIHDLSTLLQSISIYDGNKIINNGHLFTLCLSNNRVLLSISYGDGRLDAYPLTKRIEFMSSLAASIGPCYIRAIGDDISALSMYESCFNGNLNIIFDEISYQSLSDDLNFITDERVNKENRLKSHIYQQVIKELIELSFERITLIIEGKIPDDIVIFMVKEFMREYASYINNNTFIINCPSLISVEELTRLHKLFEQYCDLDVICDNIKTFSFI